MSSRMSAVMRERWASPEWRARQLEKIRAGKEAATNRPSIASGFSIGRKLRIAVQLDPEAFERVRATAVSERRPMSEIIRTYVQWGLDAEDAA